jgi:hypothetical protein
MNLVEKYILMGRKYEFFIEPTQLSLKEGVITAYSVGFNPGGENAQNAYNLSIASLLCMTRKDLAAKYHEIAGEDCIELGFRFVSIYCRTFESANNMMNFMRLEFCKMLARIRLSHYSGTKYQLHDYEWVKI